MVDLIKAISQAICDKPDEIDVVETAADTSSIIEVKVAKQDLGKMIGKHGQTAGAIRKIMYAASFKYKTNSGQNRRYQLEIIAKDGSK